MPKLSVVICTYNPDDKIFGQCLAGIIAASKRLAPNEILIIDNNSAEPVRSKEFVRDFIVQVSSAKVINETKQGLTPARLRGIKETSGDLIIFIDDDNFIDED